MSIKNQTLAHFRHFRQLCPSTTVENALQISSFMQNKANFQNNKMNINLDKSRFYKEKTDKYYEKTKPIQTQTKPILAKYWVWQSQNEPNSKPICSELVEPISKSRIECVL